MEVTFALDANGILAVTAQDTVTGAKAGAEIKAKDGRLSADEIDKMVQDAEKHRAQDDELADKVQHCVCFPRRGAISCVSWPDIVMCSSFGIVYPC